MVSFTVPMRDPWCCMRLGETKMTTPLHKVFVLRHADMFREPPRELTPYGIFQAHRVGEALARLGYKHIVLSSPYARCVQTAEIIAEHVNAMPVEQRDILREYEGAESDEEMVERAEDILRMACDLFEYNPIIISHREPIRAMAAVVFNRDRKKIAIPKAGGFVLDFGLSSQYINAKMY